MIQLADPPSWFINLFTLSILRARWIADSNVRIGQGGAGFWFAWLLQPFAQYGLAQRMNTVLAASGSSQRVSPVLCLIFNGLPFIGAYRRLKRGTRAINDAYGVQQRIAA